MFAHGFWIWYCDILKLSFWAESKFFIVSMFYISAKSTNTSLFLLEHIFHLSVKWFIRTTTFIKCFWTNYQMLSTSEKLLSNYNIGFDITEKLFVNSFFLLNNLQASVSLTKRFVKCIYAFDNIRNRLNNYAELIRQLYLFQQKYHN